MVNLIDWKVWLLTAFARRMGLQLFAYKTYQQSRCMIFATDRQTARETAEHLVVSMAIEDIGAARVAGPVVTFSSNEVKH